MSNTIDLLIQDFVTTNKLVNQNVSWETLVSRRFENGRRRIFTYSGASVATAEHLDDADGEWLQITLTTDKIEDSELRFDCLKLMYANTHYMMTVEKDKDLLIKLLTRNKGLINVVFKVVCDVSSAV
jgi:hypothetical protein